MTAKQMRKQARHERRVSRRALLKGADAAVAAVTASLFIPRMVHSEVVKIAPCPTWDRLLNHISRPTGLHTSDRRPELDRWVHGLTTRPHEPQPALLLIGPECSGKRTFHHAMGLLLTDRAVIRYPQQVYHARLEPAPDWALDWNDWNAWLEGAWLMTHSGHPGRLTGLIRRDIRRNGRYIKWCLTHTQDVDEMPNVQRHDVGLLATTVPRLDLLRRLEDEREAFRGTLLRYAA